MRFHGSRGGYVGSYGPAELGRWAARAGALARAGREVYFAFNNTDEEVGAAELLYALFFVCCPRKRGPPEGPSEGVRTAPQGLGGVVPVAITYLYAKSHAALPTGIDRSSLAGAPLDSS